MKHWIPEILAAIALLLSVAALIYQHFATPDGAWFEWWQLWHYETFIVCGVVAAVALVAGKYFGRF
jgi:succinate dehydrogenase hydrophobic anchor subunit